MTLQAAPVAQYASPAKVDGTLGKRPGVDQDGLLPSPKAPRLDDKGSSSMASASTASSAGAPAGEGGCEACGEPQVNKSRWCVVHRRAADNIMRAAMKGASAEADTDQSKAFKMVFGSRKTKFLPPYAGQPSLAVRAVLDYIERYPDGKEKATKARGGIDLTQYVHSQGGRISDDKVSQNRLWDLELFTNKMFELRKWHAARCRSEFEKLRLQPGVRRDSAGPPESPLRLAIPGWMTGDDFDESRTGTFEQKSLNRSNKAATGVNQETVDKMLAETRIGFQRPGGLADDVFQPLPKGAVTGDQQYSDRKTGLQILNDIAAELDPNASVAEASGAEQEEAHAGVGGQFVDLAPLRNRSAQTLEKDISRMESSVKVVVDACLKTLSEGNQANESFFLAAKERAKCGLDWLGLYLNFGAPPEQWTPDKCVKIDWAGVVNSVAEGAANSAGTFDPTRPPVSVKDVDAAGRHTAYLKMGLNAMALKPVESVDDMMGFTACKALVEKVGAATEKDTIELQVAMWESQKVLATQLLSSVRTAKGDLARENKSMAQRAKKEETERLAQEQKERQQQQAEIAERNRKLLRASRETQAFSIEGFQNIKAFGNDDEMDAIAKAEADTPDAISTLWNGPFVIKGSAKLAKAMEDPKLKQTMAIWDQKFVNSPDAKRDDKTTAPATTGHGVAALDALWEFLIPEARRGVDDSASLPAVRAATQDTWIYGYTQTLACCDWEPEFLGTVRTQTTGTTQVLFVSAADLAKVFPKEFDFGQGPTKRKSWTEGVRDHMKGLTKEAADQWSNKGVVVLSAVVEAGDILVTPPGYLAFTKVKDETGIASGLRKSFLCISPSVQQQFDALSTCAPTQAIQDLNDMLALCRPTT